MCVWMSPMNVRKWGLGQPENFPEIMSTKDDISVVRFAGHACVPSRYIFARFYWSGGVCGIIGRVRLIYWTRGALGNVIIIIIRDSRCLLYVF